MKKNDNFPFDNKNLSAKTYWQQVSQSSNKVCEPSQASSYYIGNIHYDRRIPSVTSTQSTDKTLINKRYLVTHKGKHIMITRREAESLLLILHQCTNNQAGRVLGLSGRTVEFYVKRLRIKFNCQTKTELIRVIKKTDFLTRIDFTLPDLLSSVHYSTE